MENATIIKAERNSDENITRNCSMKIKCENTEEDNLPTSKIPITNVANGGSENISVSASQNDAEHIPDEDENSLVSEQETRANDSNNDSDFSGDDSDGNPPLELLQPQPKIVELVDLESDSPEEVDRPVETPRRAGLRQRNYRPSFKEKNSGSDASDFEEEITPKKRRKVNIEKGFASIDQPSKFLKKLIRNPDSDLMDKYTKCFVDGRNRRDELEREFKALSEIFNKSGQIVEHICLNKFHWNEKDTNDVLNVHAILTKLCKNLVVLKLRGPFTSAEFSSAAKSHKIQNLRELIYSGVVQGSQRTCTDNDLYRIFANIFKGAPSLEEFEYTFSSLDEADQILKALKEASQDSHLKKLKSLKFRSSKEDGLLKQHQIFELSSLRAPIEYLELGNGLWADIKGSTIEKMLTNFPKLEKLIIHGFLQGDSYTSKNDMVIHFPRLEKLTKLSIGAVYEFASIFQNPDSKRGNTVTIKDDPKIEFLKFQIRLPHMPNLKSITLGNLINIDKLTFKDLPKLQTFKVGGPWNATCNFLNERPHYGVTELQFPDALKDSSLSRKIPELFPALRKLWIFLPSVVSLQGFFEAMAQAPHVKIEELSLKTQFDFESTLESCLLGRSTSSMRSQRDINNLSLLRRYSHFEEYVKYYNIELPAPKQEEMNGEEPINSPGIGVLKSLKSLHMEHIPRILRIPNGKYHWTDYRCILTSDTIGYRNYPLTQQCIDEMPCDKLETCLWPNFLFMGGSLQKFRSSGLTDFQSSRNYNISSSDESDISAMTAIAEKRKLPSVTIEPSMLRMSAFQVKKEEGI